MLKTDTVLINADDVLIDVVHVRESQGWAVRQIVPSPTYGVAYVVFEAEQEVEAPLYPHSFVGTQVSYLRREVTALGGGQGELHRG